MRIRTRRRFNITDWNGKMLVDVDGEKIGKLEDVYVDVETYVPQFATSGRALSAAI